MAEIISNENSLVLNGRASISRQGLSVQISGDKVIISDGSGKINWSLDASTDTVDGVSYADAKALFDVVSAFSKSGTGSGDAVQSVSGTLVDSTDPLNPIVNEPTWGQVSGKPATIVAMPTALGTAGQVLTVNAAGTGLEWTTPV